MASCTRPAVWDRWAQLDDAEGPCVHCRRGWYIVRVSGYWYCTSCKEVVKPPRRLR